MTGQSTAAAERSAHAPETGQTLCHVCRRPMACSYAARVLPPLVQVCGAVCAADEKFNPPKTRARPVAASKRAHGNLRETRA